MTFLDHFKRAAAREQLERGMVLTEELPSCEIALIPGWDFISSIEGVDPVNEGVWRTRHLDPRAHRRDSSTERLPMLHAGMNTAEIYARFWRLLRIFPDGPHASDIADDARTAKTGAEATDPFISRSPDGLAEREPLIQSIIGHTLLDGAEFQAWALKEHPELGKLLLEKRFTEATASHPEAFEMPWPKSCCKRWRRTGGDDFLPPVLVLVLQAELQRLAQNVTAHINLSFLEDGDRLTIAALQRVMRKEFDAAPTALDSVLPPPIAHLVSQSPLQTHALLPPDAILKKRRAAGGVRHTFRAYDALYQAMEASGDDLIKYLMGKDSNSPAAKLAQLVASHPDRRPDRKAKNNSSAVRSDFAATYWGLNWIEHAYLGIFQIALAAEAYNRLHRKDGPHLSHRGNLNHGRRGLRQSAARMARFWVQTSHPRAFRRIAIELVIELERKNVFNFHEISANDPEVERIFDENLGLDIDEAQIRKLFNSRMQTPKSGLPGITAQYHPRFWLDDSEGDIGFWIARDMEARYGKSKMLERRSSRVPLSAIISVGNSTDENAHVRSLAGDIRGDMKRFARTEPSVEAKVNQNLAMTLGEFSLDPMLSFLRRKEFLLPLFSCGTSNSTNRHTVGHEDCGTKVETRFISVARKEGAAPSRSAPRRQDDHLLPPDGCRNGAGR